MNTTITKIAAVLTASVSITATAATVSYNNVTYYNPENLYAIHATVTEVNDDVITVTDFRGDEWSWYDTAEDWFVGDIAALVMYDNETPEIGDDMILTAKYDGWVY